ncbi:SDR family oxidoreductase [Roseisalinus antarcticus]|uniref:2-dehydro-3-deoxy-D-gluconate 5-dehydrogenase n=1 Tax=Roseisalinus antarcticus TaxID=254357 RepID=A0A1Y5TNT5_9RHOB|nr:SDR family oxidoreductase [Roseisalinus antarcticus]SLN68498.1 2-dehydro-3-deoxy-D-gluconate 5-dehydrogenase [Roseisalinus antarcticus]
MISIDLSGQTALVTGASRGIGQAIALAFARAGADVVGIGTRIEDQDGGLGAEIAALGRRFMPINCDLSDRDQIGQMLQRIDEAGTEVDILVNNAGIIRRAPATDHPDSDWDDVLAVNLDAPFILARELGRRMVDRGRGSIIFVASILSFQGGITVPGYAASKGAIAQLTRALANEWAEKGVNVNAIAPGYIATDNTAALQQDPERTAALLARVPVGRWGEADEIAGPVVFLASEHARFIHGTILPVDGGWLGR